MKKITLSRRLRPFVAILFVSSAPIFVGCTNDTPDPNPGTSTTQPGSGTVTTPGTGTTTTPGSGTVVSVSEYIARTSNLSLLAAAVARAGITTDVNKGDLTLFAPSDDAFKAAGYATTTAVNAAPVSDLQRILRYHIIASRIDANGFPANVNTSYQTTLSDGQVAVYKASDDNITVNNARIVQANIPATGSVIHIINQVLIPPTINIVDLAKSNADLSLLVAAINRAGSTVQNLLTTSTQNGVTLFAPNNAAFKAAGYTNEATIQAADAKKLADLLSYHALKYRAYQQTFQNGAEIVTAQGTSIRINVSNGKVTIVGKSNDTNPANIVQGDLGTTNGVIHIIDRVLMP